MNDLLETRVCKPCRFSAALLWLLLLALACGVAPSAAQLLPPYFPALETAPDARSLGMGRAFTAIAEGPSAVWWNPGALGLPAPWSAQVFTDIDETVWIGTDDLDVYAISARFHGTGVAMHLVRLGEATGLSFDRHRERDTSVHLGAGTDLADRFHLGPPGRMRWGAGAALKRYEISYLPREFQTSRRNHASGFDLDAGSILAIRVPLQGDSQSDLFALRGPSVPFAGLRAGAVLHGVFGTEIDLTKGPGGEQPLGRQMRTGIAVEGGTSGWRRLGPVLAGTLSAELVGDLETDRHSPTRCYGAEVRLLDLLSFRYGETRDERWDFTGISRGVGMRIGLPGRAGIVLDWARTSVPGLLFRPGGTRDDLNDLSQLSGSIWFVP